VKENQQKRNDAGEDNEKNEFVSQFGNFHSSIWDLGLRIWDLLLPNRHPKSQIEQPVADNF